MRPDPLSFFLSEKIAVESEAPAPKLDPGERALAGLAAQSSAYALALPWVGGYVLRQVAEQGSVPWGDVDPLMGIRSVGDAGNAEPRNSTRLVGLLDVSGRDKNAPAREWQAVANKLDEIHGVVDSFFAKHQLGDRRVTMNFRSGALTSLMGPHYDPATRKVFAPQVSKELLLHELGHAADYTGSRFGRFRAVAEPILERAAVAAVPIALIAGDELAKAIPGTVDDHAIRFMQDHAPTILGATLAATTLFPEANASYLAMKHLKEVEGGAAARAAAKRLLPAWGTYALSVIPPIVGVALARKYLREARAENEKTAGLAADTLKMITDSARDLVHMGKQIAHGTGELVRDPNIASRIARAAEEVGTSPSFVVGALSSAVPATAGALYLYGTRPGQVLRDQLHDVGKSTKQIFSQRPHDESWRERHPAAFASIVGLGTALSAGVLSKLITDLKEVL